MKRFGRIVCRFGLIFIEIFGIFLQVLMEMGALLIIFGVDGIDIVLHGIINELFIRRVEHGR